ncbi:hypothetical protein NST21_11100 [Peribacillus sp. FSL K6-1552]|uniref:hypothetical protein n=1 Tax=Peribacillus sp. FSL K6-1552 TaxID=2954514 RepID=UPI0030F727EE
MKLKKNVLMFLILLLSVSVLPLQAGATVSDTWPVRFTNIGTYDGCTIDNHGGGNIVVRIKQWGVHSGEKASTRWDLRKLDGGALVKRKYVTSDFNSNITFYDIPRGDYTLTWVAETNNDTNGWYYVISPGADIFR